jgi:DNA-binding NtrC family response regulator
MPRILIVADSADTRKTLRSILGEDQHQIAEVPDVMAVTHHMASHSYDAIFAETEMPDGTGMDVLAAALGADPAVAVVLLSTSSVPASRLETMRRGAFDFVTTPFQAEDIRSVARRACEHTILMRENLSLKEIFSRIEQLLSSREKGSSSVYRGTDVSPRPPARNEDSVRVAAHLGAPNHGTDVSTASRAFDLSAVLEQTEKDLIVKTLSDVSWAQAEAARRMGLSRSALAYKLHKYRIRIQSKTPGSAA